MLRKIERAGMDPKTNKGGKPIACVLPGTAVGIGLELACLPPHAFLREQSKGENWPARNHGRHLSRCWRHNTPRAQAGRNGRSTVPVAGQTALIPRKPSKQASIDEVSDDPMADARAWVLSCQRRGLVKPWDAKGYKMPGGAPYHPAGFMTFVGASVMVHGRNPRRISRRQGALVRRLRGRACAFRYRPQNRGTLVRPLP